MHHHWLSAAIDDVQLRASVRIARLQQSHQKAGEEDRHDFPNVKEMLRIWTVKSKNQQSDCLICVCELTFHSRDQHDFGGLLADHPAHWICLLGSQTEPSISKQRNQTDAGSGAREHTFGVVVAELGADTVKSLTGCDR